MIELKNPNAALQEAYRKIDIDMKTAFFAAVIIAVATHAFFLTNKLPNHDSLYYLHTSYYVLTLGRWVSTLIGIFSPVYSIPWVTGISSIVFLAITAAVLVKLLEVKETVNIILISAAVVTFPTVAASLSYSYSSDQNMCAMMLAAFGVWFAKRHKLGFIAGGVSIGFSMGIYQSNIAYAAALCVISLYTAALRGDGHNKATLCLGLRYLLTGVAGVAAYFAGLFACLQLASMFEGSAVTLASYKGMDEIGRIGFSELVQGVPVSVRAFFGFFFSDAMLYNSPYRIILHTGLFCVIVCGVCTAIARNRGEVGKAPNVIILAALTVLLPLAVNLLTVVAPMEEGYIMTAMPFVLVPVFCIALMDMNSRNKEDADAIGNAETAKLPLHRKCGIGSLCYAWIGTAVCLLLSASWFMLSNVAYLNMHLRYEKTYSLGARIVDRVEQQPYYLSTTPVAVIGTVNDDNYPMTTPTAKTLQGMAGTEGDFLIYTPHLWNIFINDYLGRQMQPIEEEKYVLIQSSAEYADMGVWPDESSVRMIDGIIVVKLGN